MSGHSKWSTIKHKKGAADAKRGRLFTKLIREITMSARLGGGSPESNPRLRKAIDDAKAVNMPAENIKRAIQRGTGELPGVTYEEVTFEGYGPGGVAILIEAMTDNKNRTLPEIRTIFAKHGGNLGESGSVKFLFQKKGYIAIEKNKATEDAVMEAAIEAGAEDVAFSDEQYYEVQTSPETLPQVKAKFEERGLPLAVTEISMIPTTQVPLEQRKAEQTIKLMEALEDHDDVQNVWANFDYEEAG
ncbi:MAG TPA: YebC/PmpR family DNA-binding transcriptional regulator [Thermoanaerobaculia bacterium]|nr:YebC/PmpR family DNA-binding transcriptional regulator [Thermoanaerobaculia bacterium]